MSKLLKIFFWGLLISALGTLPLGTLNVAAMQISVSEGLADATFFAAGVVLVEILYVRISLLGMDWVRKQKRLLQWLEWIAFFIVAALAVGSFYAASQPVQTKNVLLQNNMHRFFLGLIMSAVNPVQIPFWFGWSTVLFGKKILLPKANYYNTYIAGIGLGSILGLAFFILGGHLLVDNLDANQKIINYVIGAVFSLTAIIQLIKILQNKGLGNAIQKAGNKRRKPGLF